MSARTSFSSGEDEGAVWLPEESNDCDCANRLTELIANGSSAASATRIVARPGTGRRRLGREPGLS